jgi:DnaJ family protein B protein 13
VLFDQICEAYDVLSHNERKATFDKYGEYGLKNGICNAENKEIRAYMFQGNSTEIFQKFFSTTHLDDEVFELDGSDAFGSILGSGYRGKSMPAAPVPKNVEVTLFCNLVDFYNGCVKSVRFSRQMIHPDGRSRKLKKDKQIVEIRAGYNRKTVLTYKGMGHEEYGHPTSDLVIKLDLTIDDESVWKRPQAGDNLVYTHSLSLNDAFNAAPF